ncbi:MAG: phosphopyruvate hydratase [Euryarchaeota archaeon]|nr:phosphopyruvate hydratase [Euryarchaeota archaeon]
MTSIEDVSIRRVLDSRGNATVEVDVWGDWFFGRCAAPSGASTGRFEAQALPQGGAEAAVITFWKLVAPKVVGMDVRDQAGIDALLREIDGTPNFAKIGGNVATALSLAVAKAAAHSQGVPLYRYLSGLMPDVLPYPMGNVIGGGRHAVGGTNIQEFLALARSDSFSDAAFTNAAVHKAVRDIYLKKKPGASLGKGDEGAWVVPVRDEEALRILADACKKVGKDVGFDVNPALDVAASELYSKGSYKYGKKSMKPREQIKFMAGLVETYGLASVEDPLEQEDFDGYAELTDMVGEECLVVGDDLFVTNPARIEEGIERGAANAVLIKPNQIGTLTDVLRAVRIANSAGYETIVSHRSGETADDTIAHLAVAFGSVAIKTGAVGGERISKLNELMRIEEGLDGE